jgi:hypothetical protein
MIKYIDNPGSDHLLNLIKGISDDKGFYYCEDTLHQFLKYRYIPINLLGSDYNKFYFDCLGLIKLASLLVKISSKESTLQQVIIALFRLDYRIIMDLLSVKTFINALDEILLNNFTPLNSSNLMESCIIIQKLATFHQYKYVIFLINEHLDLFTSLVLMHDKYKIKENNNYATLHNNSTWKVYFDSCNAFDLTYLGYIVGTSVTNAGESCEELIQFYLRSYKFYPFDISGFCFPDDQKTVLVDSINAMARYKKVARK